MTEGTVTDIILARTQSAERLNSMIVWSVAFVVLTMLIAIRTFRHRPL